MIIDVQRGGPSTGLPTKTEQADLLQAMFGRNGESPVAIVAPATPSDCFDMAIEAWRIAIKYRTPVIFLVRRLPRQRLRAVARPRHRIAAARSTPNFATDPATFLPYKRDPETLARPWAIPGTPGLEHRIGGLEKEDITGNVNYDAGEPRAHGAPARREDRSTSPRTSRDIEVYGDERGDLLVLGWGGTYGVITHRGAARPRAGQARVAAHLRYLNPLPTNLGDVLEALQEGAHPGDQPRPAAAAHPRRSSWSMPSA